MKVLCLLLFLYVALVRADHDNLRSIDVLPEFTSARMINKIKATKLPNFKVEGYSVYNMKVVSFKVDSAKLFKTSSGEKKFLQLGGMLVELKGKLSYSILTLSVGVEIEARSMIEEYDSSGKQGRAGHKTNFQAATYLSTALNSAHTTVTKELSSSSLSNAPLWKSKTCTADISKAKVTIPGWFGAAQRAYDGMNFDIKPFVEERLCGMLREIRE